jgi:hypothetical protein
MSFPYGGLPPILQRIMCDTDDLVPALLSTLSSSDRKAKDQTSRCLQNLSLLPANQVHLARYLTTAATALDALLGEMEAEGLAKSRDFCGRALANITRSGPASQLIAACDGCQALPRLLSLAQWGIGDASALAALILYHISLHPPTAPLLVRAGILECAVGVFKGCDKPEGEVTVSLLLMALFSVTLVEPAHPSAAPSPPFELASAASLLECLTPMAGSFNNDMAFAAASLSAILASTSPSGEPVVSRHVPRVLRQLDEQVRMMRHGQEVDNSLTQSPWPLPVVIRVVSSITSSGSDKFHNILCSGSPSLARSLSQLITFDTARVLQKVEQSSKDSLLIYQ